MPYCEKCGLDTHGGKGCPRRKKVSGKHKKRGIVSVDCETNSYGTVLFLAANEEKQTSYVYDASGLELENILEWLISVCSGQLAFGYYFDYDANQIIGMLPMIHQGQLATTGRVTWRDYKIRHIPGKRFSVSHEDRTAVIWDCASWAQCSFVKTCEEWKLGTKEEREVIKRMKSQRGNFDNSTEGELVEYTTLECALLCEWIRQILELHEECDIPLRAYSGPGSTASGMIRKVGWKPPEIDEEIQAIAELAFFGGRSEISRIGPVKGPVYGYDINSAYPAAIAALPEIAGVKWFRAKSYNPDLWGFWRVAWKQPPSTVWGLFPVRGAKLPSGRKSLSLLYPTEGVGWFHSNEVAAAFEVAPDCLQILDSRVIHPKGLPFHWVYDAAQLRLQYKSANDRRAFALKVGLNSIYGKLAQHSGTHPLQCMVYASAITAATRAALLRAAYPQGHNVVLLATDGILSTVPLDLPIGKTLGSWDREIYDSAWMLQSGVYWAGGKKRTRGIDAKTLELETVQKLWDKQGTSAELTLPSRRVLSYRLCNAQGKLHLTGTWCDTTRTVRFSPAPRRRSYRRKGGAMLTIPAKVADYRETVRMDTLAIALDSGLAFEDEGQPDWVLYDEE